jgi:hypothetical protein
MATNIVVPVDELTDAWGLRPVAGGNWTAGSYAAGAVANYGGSLYFANKQTSQVPGAGADWTLLIAAAFSPVVAFASGINAKATAPVTLVTEGGTLYACTVDHTTTGTRDGSKWLAIVSSSAGAMVEIAGGWNASTNTPTLASGVGTSGAVYRVSTAGNTVLDSVGSWNVGDYAFYSIDRWVKLRGHTVQAKDISDASASGRSFITAADVPAQRVAIGIDAVTPVDDADATVAVTDRRVVLIGLSASRTLTLPVLTGITTGQSIDIFDETGLCTPARTITVARGGSDTINGQTSFVIASPFGGVRLTKVSGAKWTAHRLIAGFNLLRSTAGSRTFLLADHGNLIVRAASGAMTDTLPVFPAGWSVEVQNEGSGALTITPASGTVAGQAALYLPIGTGVRLVSDGTNYSVVGAVPQLNGLHLLNTLTASASASLQDTASFLLPFTSFEIVFENIVRASANSNGQMTVQSGGSFQTTGYVAASATLTAGGMAYSAPTTFIPFDNNQGISTVAPISGVLRVSRPSQTTARKHFTGQTANVNSQPVVNNLTGYWDGGNGAITGFQIAMSAGNITSGIIRVYGRA